MDRSDVIYLISQTPTQNEFGVWEIVRTRRQVYCQVGSVTQTEFFEAGRNGLNPEYRFSMFFGDYAGETELEYDGNAYAVYRTYLTRTDTIELYAERKGGTNGAAENNG